MIEAKMMGLKEVVNKLEEMEKKIQRKAVRTAAKSAAKVLLEEAKARVPVKTGNLKKSLGINTRTKKGNVIVYVSPRIPDSKTIVKLKEKYGLHGKSKYEVYTKLKEEKKLGGFYGRFVELGHILREKGKGKNGKVIGHVPPKPFLRPAFEAKGEEAIRVFIKTLREEVNKLG